jgi:hypothetical protein
MIENMSYRSDFILKEARWHCGRAFQNKDGTNGDWRPKTRKRETGDKTIEKPAAVNEDSLTWRCL